MSPVQATLYNVYRIPMNQLIALATYCAGQAGSFLSWLNDGKSSGGTAGASSSPGTGINNLIK